MRKILLTCLMFCSLSAFATHTCGVGVGGGNCYIAANGSDSNSGATTSLPWLHAPGMPNCTGVCATQAPAAGDRYIFRGGDSWHFGNSSATVYIGSGGWGWGTSGSATNCQMDPSSGTVVLTSCIYIGADPTYFTGGSWTRPQFNFDNSLSTSFVASCTFNDDTLNGFRLNANYIQIDNLEFLGYCTSTSSNGSGMINGLGSPLDFSYDYFHGWTVVTGGGSNQARVENCNGSGCTGFTRVDHVVIDGSDSTGASSSFSDTMNGFGACTDVEYSVIRYIANFCVESSGSSGGSGAHIYHDNLFEFLYNPIGGGHGNVIEMHSGVSPGYGTGTVYFYNNVARHMDEGITFDLIPNSGGTAYVFNNVIYDIANGANCIGVNSNGGGVGITTYYYSNTFDFQQNVQGNVNGGCKATGSGGGGGLDTYILSDNHFINYSPAALSTFASAGTVTDNGHNLFQTECTANSQGYQGTTTVAGTGCSAASPDDYAPTSSGGGTIHFGTNYSANCSTFSIDSALCNGTTLGVLEVSYGGGEGVSSPAVTANARGTTWDAGAYQFSAAAPASGSSAQGSFNGMSVN